MTSNQIDYYNARMKAKNDRLSRKEAKRHNLASEQAQYLSATASQQSAAAAASQAATAAKRYQLEWEGEYGIPYGKDPQDRNNYQTVTEEGYEKGKYVFPNYSVPQSYALKQFQIVKAYEEGKSEQSGRYKNYSQALKGLTDAAKAGAQTYVILSE